MMFYELQVGRARKFIEGSSRNDWEPLICPKKSGHQRAGRRLTPLFLDVLSWSVVDFSRTMLSDIVVTDRAFRVMRDEGLTGFKAQPAMIDGIPSGVRPSDLPKLWEFFVTGSGGAAHDSSKIGEVFRCTSCGLVRYSAFEHGIAVDESRYDGSDFFTVSEYPKYVLVSERAKAVIEQARLTNVNFVESTKLQWPQGVAKPRATAE